MAKRYPWKLYLTGEERKGLSYIAGRYEYAKILLDEADVLDEEDCTRDWCAGVLGMTEPAGWAFAAAVDAEDGWMPLAGRALERKLMGLYSAIGDERPKDVGFEGMRRRRRYWGRR